MSGGLPAGEPNLLERGRIALQAYTSDGTPTDMSRRGLETG